MLRRWIRFLGSDNKRASIGRQDLLFFGRRSLVGWFVWLDWDGIGMVGWWCGVETFIDFDKIWWVGGRRKCVNQIITNALTCNRGLQAEPSLVGWKSTWREGLEEVCEHWEASFWAVQSSSWSVVGTLFLFYCVVCVKMWGDWGDCSEVVGSHCKPCLMLWQKRLVGR